MSFLEVKDLKVHFPIHEGIFRRVVDHVRAVDGVSFNIEQGSTYGLVGESGSGKTTTGRALIGLNEITSGSIFFEGEDITDISKAKSNIRKDIQIIFQDPFSSLNPRKRVLDIIAEPLRNFENLTPVDEFKRVLELLEIVGLASASILKYPHEFSGGQLQRIGIARVLALKPKVIIADEPVSALDVSIQAQILNFMKDLQKELNLTYLFISHDLGVIRHMCDEVAIMYRGRYVEQGHTEEIFENPQHIYTKRLVSAIPNLDPFKRDEQYKVRQSFKQEYDETHDLYFDEHGLATEMKPISPTHSAAIPSEGRD